MQRQRKIFWNICLIFGLFFVGPAFTQASDAFLDAYRHGIKLVDEGRLREAKRSFLSAAAHATYGPNRESAEFVRTLNELGNIYRNEGLPHLAEITLADARKIIGKHDSKGNIVETIRNMSYIGAAYLSLNKFNKAEEIETAAVRLAEEKIGPNHPIIGLPLIVLGQIYSRSVRCEKAKIYLDRAVDVLSNADKINKVDKMRARSAMASHIYECGEMYPDARALIEKHLNEARKSGPTVHPAFVTTLAMAARVNLEAGRLLEAEGFYLEAIAAAEKSMGPEYGPIRDLKGRLRRTYKEGLRISQLKGDTQTAGLYQAKLHALDVVKP